MLSAIHILQQPDTSDRTLGRQSSNLSFCAFEKKLNQKTFKATCCMKGNMWCIDMCWLMCNLPALLRCAWFVIMVLDISQHYYCGLWRGSRSCQNQVMVRPRSCQDKAMVRPSSLLFEAMVRQRACQDEVMMRPRSCQNEAKVWSVWSQGLTKVMLRWG